MQQLEQLARHAVPASAVDSWKKFDARYCDNYKVICNACFLALKLVNFEEKLT